VRFFWRERGEKAFFHTGQAISKLLQRQVPVVGESDLALTAVGRVRSVIMAGNGYAFHPVIS
jgi:hypothetical protein